MVPWPHLQATPYSSGQAHMIPLIRELVRNRSFTLIAGAGKQAGYDALKMAFHKDQSWLSFCLISVSIYRVAHKSLYILKMKQLIFY